MKNETAVLGILVFGSAATVLIVLWFCWNESDVFLDKLSPVATDTKAPSIEPVQSRFEPARIPVTADESGSQKSSSASVTPEEPFPPLEEPGWWIHGKVKEPNGTPVAGAKVYLKVAVETSEKYGSESTYRRQPVLTDDSGMYRTDLLLKADYSLFESSRLVPAKIEGFSACPSHTLRYAYLDCVLDPGDTTQTICLNFEVMPAKMFHGYVIKPNGDPVPDVNVYLLAPGSLRRDCAANTRVDGSFCFSLADYAAGLYKLRALRSGKGASQVLSLNIDPFQNVEAPPLIFQELGTIQGVVVDPQGTPIAGIDIVAESVSDFPTSLPTNDPTIPGAEFDSDLTAASTTSDSNGDFRLAGLLSGCYRLSPSIYDYELPNEEEYQILCDTGDRGLQMVLELYQLIVNLSNAEGERILVADLTCDRGDFQEGLTVLGGTKVFYVYPGIVRLLASTEDGLAAEKVLTIREGTYRYEVDLTLRETERGRLALTILDPSGKTLSPAIPLAVLLNGDKSWVVQRYAELSRDTNGNLIFDLVPDTYRISLNPGDLGQYELPQLMYLPTSMDEPLIIETGGQIDLHMTIRVGGRLRLTVNTIDANERLMNPKINIYCPERDDSTSLSSFFKERGSNRPSLYAELIPDVPYLFKKILKKSAYRLEVIVDGFSPAEAVFTITPRQITDLTVTILPE